MLVNSWEFALAGYNSLAGAFGLRLLAFEGGLDTGYYDINVPRKIACSFDPRMTGLITNYLSTWSACLGQGDGAGLFNYYNLASVYGVNGTWGLTDNINLPSVKTAAIDAMMGRNPASFECSWVAYDPSAPPPGTGTGLSASYYRDPNFGQLDRTQVDAMVDFWRWPMSWAVNLAILPAQLVGPYSVVWTGTVEPKYDQTYTFYTLSEHPIRLIVDGITLVEEQTEHQRHGIAEHQAACRDRSRRIAAERQRSVCSRQDGGAAGRGTEHAFGLSLRRDQPGAPRFMAGSCSIVNIAVATPRRVC